MIPALLRIRNNAFPAAAFLGLVLLAAHPDSSAGQTPAAAPLSGVTSTAVSALSSSVSSSLTSTLTSTPDSAPISTIISTPAVTVTISGSLLERGTKRPLSLVNIYCFPATRPDAPLKAVTDRSGKFSIDVPEGMLKWVISASGYTRWEREDEQRAAMAARPRIFYLEKKTYLTYETTVYGETEKRDDKTRSLDQSQFSTLPGSGGDPVKSVQNLPGVNRPGAFSSQVIIEGSSPRDTQYNVDNQSIPMIFHFGGLSSVVMPEAVDHVDYLSAGFGPEFGQTTAGLVNLTVKDPQTDRMHGFIYADTMNAGGMVEGPVNDHSSYLFGLRQSYIGYIMRAVVGDDNKDFNLTAVPEFRDIVFVYRNQVAPADTFKLVTIGSQDTFSFLLKHPVDEDPAFRGSFNLDTKFFRVIPEWTHRFSPDATGRLSLGAGEDLVRVELGDYYIRTDRTALTGRAELENMLTGSWKSYLGMDFQHYGTTVRYQLPRFTSVGGIATNTGELETVSRSYDADYAGLYWRNVLHRQDSRWSFIPGLRVSWFNMTDEVLPEPRVGVRYALGKNWVLRAASGLYSQAPAVQNLDKNYGNPDLTSERAVHYTIGIEKDFSEASAEGWSFTNDLFYKRLYELVAQSMTSRFYDNSGYGHAYGMEFMGKYRSSTWKGWIAYTLSRSTRGDALQAETVSQYDQTHIFTVLAERELGHNWKVSARVRYTTGDPYTPIVGAVYDVDNDKYVPVLGDIYSSRMGPFFQADVRVDKKWVYDRWIVTAYLDVQNITNQQNAEEIRYSYNYQRSEKVTGLPVYPTFGVKLEF